MSSLRQRFNLFWALGLSFAFGIQWLLAVVVLDLSTDAYIVSRLKHDHESFLAALAFSPEGLPILNHNKLNPSYSRPFSGHYYHLKVASVDLYSRSLWQTPLPIQSVAVGQDQEQELDGPSGQRLLVYSAKYQQGIQEVELAIAEDLTPLYETIRYFSWLYALISLLFLILLLLAQSWLLKRSLQPLEQISIELQGLALGDIKQISEEVPKEVQPLVQEFNRLLDVLGRRLSRSRNALSNLTHALKKPISLMTNALDHPLNIHKMSDKTFWTQQIEEIQRLIEHELRRAQLAGSAVVGENIDLKIELPLLIRLLELSYPQKQVSVSIEAPETAVFRGDRQDILELLGNLLDNAFKWANTKIKISLKYQQGLFVSIEDDGPGCPEEQLASLIQRGSRLDQNMAGHGFGLAIANEITQSYDGRLTLKKSNHLGGFEVQVYLPSKK